ncbi:MAG: tRNA (adenosine(37)-N6)-threonylcarbamoyltransferase complex ATPase subunit type 1 TsaE, partial [Candidatus Eisenbacteria bacterium]
PPAAGVSPGAKPMAGAYALSSGSPGQTERLGESLAPLLAAGDVVALVGPLGAGKTRFVAGLARGLGYAARVRSPTFTLLHEYPGPMSLFHADLYRIETRDVAGLGLEEALERGPLVVEWAERLPAPMLGDALHVEFEVDAGDHRRLTVRATGTRGQVLLDAWRPRA